MSRSRTRVASKAVVGSGAAGRSVARVYRAVLLVAAGMTVVESIAWAQPEIKPDVRPPEMRLLQDKAAEKRGVEPPEISGAVRKAIDAEFLSEEERKDLRVFHGVWTETDLDTPRRKAKAALIRGAYDDASLSDGEVEVEDRAEAMLQRGDLEQAVGLLAETPSVRAMRIKAEALKGLGRVRESGEVLDALVKRLDAPGVTVADLVEGVRARLIRARVQPQKEPAGGDFKRMQAVLSDVYQKLDRLYWPALVAEAELLYEKNNPKQAGEAAIQALTLNPKAAAAWLVLGKITVDQFNFERTESVAAQLEGLLESTGDGPVSAEAAVIIAKAQLRQNDPDAADAALDRALERYPRMRSLLATKAAATALRYDTDKTEAAIAAFEELSPGSADALFEVGKTMAEARQYQMAAGYLIRAAERAPHWVEPAAELGLMGLQSGDDASALANLTKAAHLDPFNTRVTNSLSLATEMATYERLDTPHFLIRYAPGPDEVLAKDMVTPLEAMYARVTGNGTGGIDHEPPFKTVIDLMPNQRWFAVRIAGVTGIHTMAASTGPTIAMAAPREGPGHKVGAYDWLRVVRHEFTHTVTLSRTRNRIPHWFTEASAVNMEDSPRDYTTCKLLDGALTEDSLLDFGDINIAFVRPKKPTDRQQAYAQGQWMYEYMITRWGNRAPLDLMDRYAAGDREAAAIQAVLGLSQAEFMDQFKDWARTQVHSWGMGEWKPTIKELLEDEGNVRKARAGEAPDGEKAKRVAEEEELPEPTLTMVQGWLEKHPEHPDVLALSVRLTLEETDGKPSEAMEPLLERYAKARPVDPLPHRLMTRVYSAREAGEAWAPERAAKAIPHLEYLDDREQNSAAYAAELARAYQVVGELDKAAAKADRACIVSPYDADYRELAATVALMRKDYATAERHIVALTKLEPDRAIHAKRLEAVRKMRGNE
jgi:cellulose synthase operon protein C